MKRLFISVLVLVLSSTLTLAASNINISGTVNATQYYGLGTNTLNADITGTASTTTLATSANELSCSGCIGGTEIDESSLSGTAASLTAGDVSCTNCLGSAEIVDVYLLNTGDTGTGDYDFDSQFMIQEGGGVFVNGSGAGTETLNVRGSVQFRSASPQLVFNDTAGPFFRIQVSSGNFTIAQNVSDNIRLKIGGQGIELVGSYLDQDVPGLIVRPSGKVGIGNANPESLLAIGGNDSSVVQIEVGSVNYTFGMNTSEGGLFGVSGSHNFATPRILSMNGSGSVAIGTTQIAETLHVNGSIKQLPPDPVIVGSITDSTNLDFASRLEVQGHLAYVSAENTGGMSIIDIRDPTNPYILSTISGGSLTNAYDLEVQGNYAYVIGGGSQSLTVIDVSDPYYPYIVSFINFTHSSMRGLFVDGPYAYAASSGADRIIIVDISDPARLNETGEIALTNAELDQARRLYVREDYAYVVNLANDSMTIINVTNKRNPTLVGTISDGTYLDAPYGIDVVGGYAFVTSLNNDSLTIINVTNPASPVIVGSVSDALLNGALWVQVAGDYAYVTGANSWRLIIVDVSDVTNPRILHSPSSSSLLNGAREVKLQGRYAYAVAAGADSFVVLDIGGSDIQALETGSLGAGNMQVIGEYHMDGNVQVGGSASVAGNMLVQGPLVVGEVTTGAPSMYVRTAFTGGDGSSDCDDNPQNCCDPGYHFCTIAEFLEGGRRVEVEGTNRVAAPYGTLTYRVDPGADSATIDCNGWTSSSSSDESFSCGYTTTASCQINTNDCAVNRGWWCCSD